MENTSVSQDSYERLRSNVLQIGLSVFLSILTYLSRFTPLIPLSNQTIICKDVLPYRESSSVTSNLHLDDGTFISLLVCFLFIVIGLTEVALGLHGGFSKKECGYNFYRTLLTAMNGVFAVVILASALQRLSGNVRPTFLSICPNACLWPETTFRLSDMLEDVKNCYNASVLEETTKSRHLKELLVETRSSFPSLQESLSTFCTVFVTGLWHRKHTRKVGHLIATLLLSIMCLLVFLLANGKLTRHENWIQDIVGGCLLGIIVALHQLICLFGMDVEQEKKGKTNIASMEEVQMKQIVIPRVRYRGSLIHRKRSSSGVMNPCFVGVQPC